MNGWTLSLMMITFEGEYAPWILTMVLAFIAMVLLIYYGHLTRAQEREIKELHKRLDELAPELAKLEELESLIPQLKKIAHLDHDINTPLCVITMSLGRAKSLAQTNDDESLKTNVEDILEAVRDIGDMMTMVRVLKTTSLIPYKDKVNK